MFLKWNQVILIQDQAKRHKEDAVVYLHGNGELQKQNLWPAFDEGMRADYEKARMHRYGTTYQDANGSWCIVPDVWNENDALRARDWIAK